MKNNNRLSKFKQVLQLSGFTDVTEHNKYIYLGMVRAGSAFVITEKSSGKYSVEYKNNRSHHYAYMSAGDENQAMDYIREILMEVA